MHWSQLPFSTGIWFWAIINWLVPIGLIVLGIVGLVLFLRARDRNNMPTSRRDSALRIIRERFARGEISEDEFDRMQRKLTER